MHVTQYEQLDRQHKFEEMMELVERDMMWVAWIKMSRLTFGPWRIEEYEPFQKRWGKYINDYENIDVLSFTARVREWLASPGAASS